MLVLYYPKCSTCKNAIKWLNDNNIKCDFRDIKLNNPTYDEIKYWHNISGQQLKKFFNTNGLIYKSLNLKEKLTSMTEDEMYKLLSTEGMLVKRPLVITDSFVLIGFKEQEWAGKLL